MDKRRLLALAAGLTVIVAGLTAGCGPKADDATATTDTTGAPAAKGTDSKMAAPSAPGAVPSPAPGGAGAPPGPAGAPK